MLQRSSKFFIFFAMLTAFCIAAEYALAKPSVNSAFISAYGHRYYAYAWLAALPLNLLVVMLYNRYVGRTGCLRMFIITASFGLCINAMAASYLTQWHWFPFLLYLWKDVYVLIMFQQLWSVIHISIAKERAKSVYGLIFGVGGLGSICASMIPLFFAVELGSCHILFFNLPLYFCAALCYAEVLKRGQSSLAKEPLDPQGGLQLIKDSRALQFILLIVVAMQVASNLFEYQFYQMIERHYKDLDLRTQFYGKWWGTIHMINLLLQFVGSYLFAKWLGLKKSHIFVPVFLLINALAFLSMPTVLLISVAFGTIKAFDYSLFAILKEMLYNPLKTEEKFKAKAIIDVFAYRASKVLASFAVIALQFIGNFQVIWIASIVFCLWALAAIYHFRSKPALAAKSF